MIFCQLSLLCLPPDTSNFVAFAPLSPLLCPPQDNIASVTPQSSIMSRALLPEPAIAYYVSLLDYIANVSLSDFLVLSWILFLSAPSACSCKVRTGILQLLTTLLGVLRKAFLLLFQRTSVRAFLLVFWYISVATATTCYTPSINDDFLIHSSSSPTVHHHNSACLLATALDNTTVMGMTTDNADYILLQQ